jgi:Tol biopolymer transport system component
MKKQTFLVVLLCIVAIQIAGTPTFERSLAARQADPGYIAFLALPDGIYVMRPDGSSLTKLTNVTNEFGGGPIWSPDGTHIAFVKASQASSDIYMISMDGSNLTNLTNDSADEREIAWSPDGTKIVFSSRRNGGKDQLYLIDPSSGVETRLSFSSSWDGGPDWSPDGKFIVYVRNTDISSPLQICVMASNGSSSVRLTTGTSDNFDPQWSPDGKKIAFTSTRDGRSQIYIMNSDGTSQQALSPSKFNDSSPRWSPNGEYVAFRRSTLNKQGVEESLEVYIVGKDGSKPTHIEYKDGEHIVRYGVSSYAWSPDSKQIASAFYPENDREDIYIANVECLYKSQGCPLIPLSNITKYKREFFAITNIWTLIWHSSKY